MLVHANVLDKNNAFVLSSGIYYIFVILRGCTLAVKTTLEQLEEVQTAISAILTGGQSTNWSDKGLTRASLSELRKMESDLKRQYNAESGTGGNAINYGYPKR